MTITDARTRAAGAKGVHRDHRPTASRRVEHCAPLRAGRGGADRDRTIIPYGGATHPTVTRRHQQLLHCDEQTLRFAWDLGGEHTTTEITLAEEADGGTVVT